MKQVLDHSGESEQGLTTIVHPGMKKQYQVKNLRLVSHAISEDGTERDVECVEFLIVGNNSEWEDWALYEDFKELNPNISIENKT